MIGCRFLITFPLFPATAAILTWTGPLPQLPLYIGIAYCLAADSFPIREDDLVMKSELLSNTSSRSKLIERLALNRRLLCKECSKKLEKET